MAKQQATATSWALRVLIELPKSQEHREGLEPSSPRDQRFASVPGAVSSPLDDQCLLSVGPEGLEPSPGGLRVRCAAASTLVPCCTRVGAEGVEPRAPTRSVGRDPYRRPALAVELRAAHIGPEGLEPSPDGLKVRYAAITPRPCAWSGICVSSGLLSTFSPPFHLDKW
jgi:hypothetical protein